MCEIWFNGGLLFQMYFSEVFSTKWRYCVNAQVMYNPAMKPKQSEQDTSHTFYLCVAKHVVMIYW